MDKEKLVKLKDKLSIIKNKFGIPAISLVIIMSMTSCNNTNRQQTTENIKQNTTENITTEEISNDDYILNEFEEKENEIKELINKNDIETAKIKAKEYFIKSVDFIFYGSEINGITYDDLKDESKHLLFTQLCEMDEIIESVSPNYKENLSEKYKLVKDFTKEKYYYSLDKIKQYIGEEKYDEIGSLKDRALEFKDDHQDEIDNIKDKTKEKTSEYKLKFKDWYENYKEE